jgi:hypothetical protein
VRDCSDGDGGEDSLGGGGGGAHTPEDHGGGDVQTSYNGSGGSQSGSLLGVEWSDAVRPLACAHARPCACEYSCAMHIHVSTPMRLAGRAAQYPFAAAFLVVHIGLQPAS